VIKPRASHGVVAAAKGRPAPAYPGAERTLGFCHAQFSWAIHLPALEMLGRFRGRSGESSAA